MENFRGDKNIVKQYNNLNSKLTALKKQLHKLDDLSYAFHYPIINDEIIPNFDNKDVEDKDDVIYFKELKYISP